MNTTQVIARLSDASLPCDDRAELCVLAALMHAPRQHAIEFAKRIDAKDFYNPYNAFVFEWLKKALLIGNVSDENDFIEQMKKTGFIKQFREKFGSRFLEMYQWSIRESGWWWYGHWYVGRVLTAAVARKKYVHGIEALGTGLEAELDWRKKGSGRHIGSS